MRGLPRHDTGKKKYQIQVEEWFINHVGEDPNHIPENRRFRMKEHDELFWKMETYQLMHELSYEYYWQKAFIINILILIIGAAISFFGIFAGAPAKDSDPNEVPLDGGNSTANRMLQEPKFTAHVLGQPVEAMFVHITGILGIVITFLKSLEKYLNWNSMSDMHNAASTSLRDICDEISGTRIDVSLLLDKADFLDLLEEAGERKEDHLAADEIEKDEEKNKFHTKHKTLSLTKAKFDTMRKTCTCPIPLPIMNAFVELKEVFKYASYDVKIYLYRKYYTKMAEKFRKSVFLCTPPFILACFKVDDIYKDLLKECKDLLPRLEHLNEMTLTKKRLTVVKIINLKHSRKADLANWTEGTKESEDSGIENNKIERSVLNDVPLDSMRPLTFSAPSNTANV